MLPVALVVCLFGPPSDLSAPRDGTQEADAKPRVAIAPIAYSATIPDHTRMAVHATVAEAVKRFARSALVLDVDAECRTRECAIRQARDANAELLLEMRVIVDERDYAIELVVIAADDGRSLGESSGECRLCAQAELLVAIAAQLAAIEATLEHERPIPSRVDPSTADHSPGLAPDRFDAPPARRSKLEIGGWVSVALGLAGAGAGAALLAIDGREHGPTCGAEDRDINGACPNIYTTQLAGIVSVSAGGLAIATGAGLVIAGKSRRTGKAAARLTPALGGLRLEF